MPGTSLRSGWIDTNSDAGKDAWEDTVNATAHSLTELDAMSVDIDGDGAYNDEELAYGSDPFDLDSDDDGLNDGDEIHLANEQAQKGYSLLLWDSNDDGVSDHDDFYGFFGVTYPSGIDSSFPNASYSDYDGDGIKNPFDPYPIDPTNNDADGDGLDDSFDPAPGDSTNYSEANAMTWYGSALEDSDFDGTLNFWDPLPHDQSNGSNDSDNDGLDNLSDPFPSDNSNYSPINGMYWYGNVLGDDDWDGISNYSDSWPYDSSNGSGGDGGGIGSNDNDGDGIDNNLDPAPDDQSNSSPYNWQSWYAFAIEDADNDGTTNFDDPYPYDPYNGNFDIDGDGVPNDQDPFPSDANNFSSINNTAWNSDLFSDPDTDGIPNWQDPAPYDPNNGSQDVDGDGISNDADPYPQDPSNYSSINLISWGGNVLGDDDEDGILNWADDNPYADSDGDGLPDNMDPAPSDASNFSTYNTNYWPSNALADADGDGVLNYWDQWPDDPTNNNPDMDFDGFLNGSDPAPTDYSNHSPTNSISWYGSALGDADNDGTPNFYDINPYVDENADTDSDGYLDIIDPAPNDSSNNSPINAIAWFNDALGDADYDNTQNFYDSTPHGPPPPVDVDQDGLSVILEGANGTSDTDPDSDDDGLTDYEEVMIYGTSPTNAHHLSQARNLGNLYTDWQLIDGTDTDQDEIPDRIELHYNLNPAWPGDARLDRDNNGLTNLAQYQRGIALDVDLEYYDADGDGMSDVFEDYYSPALSKSNAADAVLDFDDDGVLNYEEMQLVLSPQVADTYQTGGPLGDLLVLMTSVCYPATTPPVEDINPSNSIPDWADAVKSSPSAPDFAYFTRQVGADLDGDGMPDAWEHRYGRWKYPAGGLDLRSARDAGYDPDHDGLTNLTEYRFGTNPLAPETQSGTNDRSRFNRHGSTTSTTIPGGGGLMSRYRAQIAADLSRPSVYRSFSLEPEIDPTPLSPPGSSAGPEISLNPVRTHYVYGNPVDMESMESQDPTKAGVELRAHYEDAHPCDRQDCQNCDDGKTTCTAQGCHNGTLPYNHEADCPTTVKGACPGHFMNCTGGMHTYHCSEEHFISQSQFTCTLNEHSHTPECVDNNCQETEHYHSELCYSDVQVSVPHAEANCRDGTSCDESCGLSVPGGPCPGEECPLRKDEVCPTCDGKGKRPEPCPNADPLTCPYRPDCPDCENGEAKCKAQGCDQGVLKLCRCGDSDCDCYGIHLDCPKIRDDTNRWWAESGVVNIHYQDQSDTSRFRVLKNGWIVGYLGPNTDSRSVNIDEPPVGETVTVNVEPADVGTQSAPEEKHEQAQQLSVSDGAGGRYRKIGLNGFPLPDAKPQAQDESGEVPEETYIDAYTRQLKHSVTDVYNNVDGSLLPLMVRRDTASETWKLGSGRRPEDKPNLPFGAGWSSNLCSYIQFESQESFSMVNIYNAAYNGTSLDAVGTTTMRAVVVDEQGAAQTYVQIGANRWAHTGEEQLDARTSKNAFDGSVLVKKFGTTCIYEDAGITQKTLGDRVAVPIGEEEELSEKVFGEGRTMCTIKYSRLLEVRDRLGNRLRYKYAGPGTLIPESIYDPDRPGRDIQIAQQNGRVVALRGPGGQIIDYSYSGLCMQSVTRGSNSVQYAYEQVSEPDESGEDVHNHINVHSITDELSRQYVFHRVYDHKHLQSAYGTSRSGLPRTISAVTSPYGTAHFSGSFENAGWGAWPVNAGWGCAPSATSTCQAVDGTTTTYVFQNPYIYDARAVHNGTGDSANAITVTYTSMSVTQSKDERSFGTEIYTYNPAASFALASATDRSANTTLFTYGADGYDDPLTETDALGNTRRYEYDQATRIMTMMTDALGNVTDYTLNTPDPNDPNSVSGQKLVEKFTGTDGTVRETRYQYNHPIFKGLVTGEWAISSNPDAMPSRVTAITLAQAPTNHWPAGDTWYDHLTEARTSSAEPQGANYGWWYEITQTSGSATAEGGMAETLTSTTAVHDFNGAKRSVIDARGLITNFNYDGSGRLIAVAHPDGSTKVLEYDAHGNLLKETNENGVATFHAYDDLNRRIRSILDLNNNDVADPTYLIMDVRGAEPMCDGDIVTSTTYNSRNQVVSHTDSRGRITMNTYDGIGRLTAVNVAGLLSHFFYDGQNNGGSVFATSAMKPNRTADPRGVITTVVYDKLYRPISSTVAAPDITAVTLTEYDELGRAVKITDALNRDTLNTYDALGQLIRVKEPDLTSDTTDNPAVHMLYAPNGKPWKIFDQNGSVTETIYDALGRRVKVISPAVGGISAISTMEYDAAGNAIRVTDALGRETETVYDVRNRPVEVMAPTVWDATIGQFVRPTSTTTYDALGQVLSVTDPLGAVSTTHYDHAGRKWKMEAPAPESGVARPTTLTTFDAGGLVLTVTSPLNQTVTNRYDIHGRLITTVDAKNITNSFEYDAAGNRTCVTDGKNQTTTFAYDGLNRLVGQTFANGDTWTHAYNAIQKESQTSPRGIVTSYTYDARDRLMTVSAPAHNGTPALGRGYTYDNAGRLLTIAEAGNADANVSYVYDAMGRVTAESSRGQTHHYAYDLAGNRTHTTYSTGRAVQTSYDGLNRPEVISEGGRSTRYGYDRAGRAVVLVAGNGQTSTNTYDALGRLQDRTLFKTSAMSEGEVQAEFSWEHDALGNVLVQHETWPGEVTRQGGIRSTVMVYDNNNRLLSETIQTRSSANASAVDQSATTYTYDAANNRAAKTVTRIAAPASSAAAGENETGHWEYTYNEANQLTGWEKWDEPNGSLQKVATLGYDDAGNRISQTVDHISSSANDEMTAYAWDAQDRLLGVTTPPGNQENYQYDYRTRRIGTSSTMEGATEPHKQTAIVFSGGLSVAEWESDTGSLPPSPTVEYTRGPDMGGGVGGLLYSLRSESSAGLQSIPKYNLSNGRGDVVAQSNQSATLTWTASYEAYGKRTKETGANQDKQRGNSKDEDPTGLLNEGFRYRDLETGVWLSRDPAGFVDGPNLYAYVKQNPWSGFDPKGLAEKRVTGAGHEVKGKGHHLNPVELWDKQGFTDKGAHEIFDKATVAAPDHNFTAHGSKTGYTAQVEGEFDAFKQDWASKNKTTATVGEMSAKQQQQLAQEFVEHIKPGGPTTNGYIKGFNEVVGKGPAEVAKWEATSGKSLFKPLVASETAFVAASGRKIPYLSYAGRAMSKTLIVGSVILGGAAVAHAGQTDGPKGALIESSVQLSSIATMGASDLCRAFGDVQTWHMEQSKETQSAGDNSYYGWMGNFSMW